MERMLFVSVMFVHALEDPVPFGVGKYVNSLANHQGKLSSTKTLTDVDTSSVCINVGASDCTDEDASVHDSSASIHVIVSYDPFVFCLAPLIYLLTIL